MDTRLLALLAEHLPAGAAVTTPSPTVAAALRSAGWPVLAWPSGTGDRDADCVALLDDELSREATHAEGLLAEAARHLRPRGLIAATAVNRVHAAATGRVLNGLRGYTAVELRRMLGHRGFTLEVLCSPGAAARLGGGTADPALDREPGLLDAGERLLAVARAPADREAASATFFETLPRKVVAAAVLCRAADGRVLVVHDSFKRHWTIPGGVVDPDEDPETGAAREAWEEAGVRVHVGLLLGVFAGTWPDRLLLVYAATPDADAGPPAPVHAHEIDAAEWLPLEEALRRVAPHVARQVRACLDRPGRTWRQ